MFGIIRKRESILLALLTIALALHLWSLMRFPAPFVDEAWFAGRAWAFIRTHQAFGPLDQGVFDRFEGYSTFFPWLPVLLQSLALRMSPEPALLSVRIVSLFFGFLLLFAIYTIGSRLYGKQLGLLSVFLVTVSLPFLQSAHLARYDIIVAALGFIAIALYLNNQSSRVWVSLVSGLCIGLAFETHPHGAIYGPAAVALNFLHCRWSMFRKRQFWAFVVGIGLGLVFYALLHIIRYPRTYFTLNQLAYTVTHTPPILTLDPWVILQALSDTWKLLTTNYRVLILLILCAVVALARRRSEADKTLLVLNAALIGGVILLLRNKFYYYAILFTPAIDLMLGAFLLMNLQRPWKGKPRDFARHSLIWGLCIATIVVNLSILRTNSWVIFQRVRDSMAQVVQQGDSIMGSQTYWFGLYDHDYYSWEQLIYYQRFAPGSTLEDALREFRPDIFIVDPHIAEYISDEEGESVYSQHLRLPRGELEAFLNRQANLIAVFDDRDYGEIRVHRILWGGEEGSDDR